MENSIDNIVKDALSTLPKKNSLSLKSETINRCVESRLNEVNTQFDSNETLLFKLLNNRPSDSVRQLIKNIKFSNELINQTDGALTKLFDNLGSS